MEMIYQCISLETFLHKTKMEDFVMQKPSDNELAARQDFGQESLSKEGSVEAVPDGKLAVPTAVRAVEAKSQVRFPYTPKTESAGGCR